MPILRRLNTNPSPPNDTLVNEHNLISGAKKNLPVVGQYSYLAGPGVTGLVVTPGTLVALYNNAATVGYVALNLSTDATPATPAAPGNQIMQLKPNDYSVIAMGTFSKITTSANITAYMVVDTSTYSSTSS